MTKFDKLASEVRGHMAMNELLTSAMLFILTKDRADQAAIIHQYIGLADAMINGMPERVPAEQSQKAWAKAYWNNLRPVIAQVAMLDANGNLVQ